MRASVKAPFAKPRAASPPPSVPSASAPSASAAAVAAAARPTCSPFDVRARAAELERGYLLALEVRAATGAGAALQDALQRLRAAGAPQRAANMRAHELRTRRRMHIVVGRGWRDGHVARTRRAPPRRGAASGDASAPQRSEAATAAAEAAAEAAAAAKADRAAAAAAAAAARTRVLAAQARAQLDEEEDDEYA